MSQPRWHRGYCGANGKCSCFSDRSGTVITEGFGPHLSPPSLAVVNVEVEDDFRRPATGYKIDGGNGLGPQTVWMENTMEPRTRIEADEEVASVKSGNGGGACYLLASAHWHAYAEVLWVNDLVANPDRTYNLDVIARNFGTSPVMKAYLVKLANDPFAAPTLFIQRIDGGRVDLVNPPPTLAQLALSQPKCDPLTALEQVAPANPNRSKPLWLRIEVDDRASPFPEPVITATAAWDCPAAGTIDDCLHVCTLTAIDTGDPSGMFQKTGTTGLFAQHGDYFAAAFRAG